MSKCLQMAAATDLIDKLIVIDRAKRYGAKIEDFNGKRRRSPAKFGVFEWFVGSGFDACWHVDGPGDIRCPRADTACERREAAVPSGRRSLQVSVKPCLDAPAACRFDPGPGTASACRPASSSAMAKADRDPEADGACESAARSSAARSSGLGVTRARLW